MSRVDDPDRWTGPTPYLDFGAPHLKALAQTLAMGRPSAKARALAAFYYVRDQVRFGFHPAFYALKASEVLSHGRGFCNNQSTLMVALLRALGVPARAHFVDISADVLDGVLDPRTPYVDHSWTEAWIDGRWVAVDAYIVDPPLMAGAKRRLRAEGRMLGYGAHVNARSDWDAWSGAFSQFVNDGAVARLSTRDHGVFDDVQAFYAAPGPRWNRRNPVLTAALLATVGGINRRIEAIREGQGLAEASAVAGRD
jgi:transglutaminase-like putative cysteine protease